MVIVSLKSATVRIHLVSFESVYCHQRHDRHHEFYICVRMEQRLVEGDYVIHFNQHLPWSKSSNIL